MDLFFLTNFTYWQQNLVEMSMQGYVNALGFFFYPILFTFIIAYVYIKMQSAVAAVVILLLIMAVFGNTLLGVDIWVTIMHILAAIVTMSLVLVFIIKRRGG